MKERYFYVSLPYATFGVGVTDGRVSSAAPIARWALGKEAGVLAFYRRKGADIVEITKLIEEKRKAVR
jgi:hypothetical protein